MGIKRQTTVLITGCSDGSIGHSLALKFHARGLRVFATARSQASMKMLSDKGIETFELDVTKTESIQAVKEKIKGLTSNSLDILVNNAGVFFQMPFTDLTIQRVRDEMAVNFFGVCEMTIEFMPLLLNSSDARVVLLGSIAAVFPVPFYSIYNASKAALAQLGNTLRVELAPLGIKVIQTYTGPVQSNILKPVTLPSGSLYYPVKERYEMANMEWAKSTMSQEAFARGLANEILKDKPKAVIWNGANGTGIRILAACTHATGMDWIVSRMLELNKMPRRKIGYKRD